MPIYYRYFAHPYFSMVEVSFLIVNFFLQMADCGGLPQIDQVAYHDTSTHSNLHSC